VILIGVTGFSLTNYFPLPSVLKVIGQLAKPAKDQRLEEEKWVSIV